MHACGLCICVQLLCFNVHAYHHITIFIITLSCFFATDRKKLWFTHFLILMTDFGSNPISATSLCQRTFIDATRSQQAQEQNDTGHGKASNAIQ